MRLAFLAYSESRFTKFAKYTVIHTPLPTYPTSDAIAHPVIPIIGTNITDSNSFTVIHIAIIFTGATALPNPCSIAEYIWNMLSPSTLNELICNSITAVSVFSAPSDGNSTPIIPLAIKK